MTKSSRKVAGKEISRRQAILIIKKEKAVICHTEKEDFYEISTMEDLSEMVALEQKGIIYGVGANLKFYEKN